RDRRGEPDAIIAVGERSGRAFKNTALRSTAMERQIAPLASFLLDDHQHAVIFGRRRAIVEKTDADIDFIAAAIILAIKRQLNGPIAGEQLGPRKVANRLNPVAGEISVADAESPAVRFVGGLKHDFSCS